MHVVVCGASGQLGAELVELFSERGCRVDGFDLDLDITNHDLVMEKLIPLTPELIVNAAADIDADNAESNPEKSYSVNFTGTQNLVLACLKIGCPMGFVSSDYVFDGTKGEAYNEFDGANPLGVYGRAKLASENYMMSVLGSCYIFRTQWL
ncbi:MAG: sugar nucleotide-binding protein, partial [Actinobacteria bacterium]|nr:sugar nucleotide-binding protein [Actinomycetota bacterium]